MPIEPIAIVGASCRLPGSSNSLDSLWELLADGGEAWSSVPADRFNEAAFHHPNASDPNGTNNHQGGHFIDGDIRDFDHAFFHLSPQHAAAMDPQQRILLELVYEAFESAGWAREACAGSRTAVFAAIFGTDYDRNLCKDVLDLPVYHSVGTGIAILANRISHAFDLRGPSLTLDTGCSGGLVALHEACQSLRNGESDAALVAAANLQLMPDHYIGMSSQHMVSSTGRCYPFDLRGDGYGRGEGFVVVALKRLSDALRDQDPIRSVILNSGINQDGYTASGITHPNRVAQADLIRDTYDRLHLHPQDTAYVEAHGTGTVAGDSEELAAIAEVFAGRNRSLPLHVGSNKGSIGHTESTSGLASLLKAILMLDRQVIPPVAGFTTPKPGLPLDRITIPTQRLPWPLTEGMVPRISINSFGYGGTNAHAIVERGPRTYDASCSTTSTNSPRLFVLSANNQGSLKSLLESYVNWIQQHPKIPLADISYTLCHRRSALPWRFSCVADNESSLLDTLERGVNLTSTRPPPSKRQVIYVFTGQGAQWAGMGHELLLETTPSSVFRDSIRISRDILYELGATWDLEAELLAQDGGGRINKAELAQPATTAVQIGIVMLLRSQGVRPWAVVGHSSGEIAAAYAAGRLSHHMALRVAFHRGLMPGVSKDRGLPPGAMLSIGLGQGDAAPYLHDLTHGEAAISCINSPNSVTVSGDAAAVDEVMARIIARGDGTFCRKLRVDTAYHSHHMRAIADEYRTRLGDLDLGIDEPISPPGGLRGNEEVKYFSSISGLSWVSDFAASYWVDNLISPVRFSDAIQTLAREHHKHNGGLALFVEIGPHAALAGPIRQCLAASNVPKLEYNYLSALKRGTGAVETMLQVVGHLFERGVRVNFDEITALTPGFHTAAVRPDLPSYCWDYSSKHWHESRLSREYRMRREPYHHLLGVRMTELASMEPRWRHMVGLATLPWLAHHIIDGLIIFPGACYVCMVVEAVRQLAKEQYSEQALEAVSLRDVSFLRALVVPDAPSRVEMQLSLKHRADASPLSFTFSVTALSDGKWHVFCTGVVEGVMALDKPETESVMLDPHPKQDWLNGIVVIPEELYNEMAADGNTYGPSFRGLRSLTTSTDGLRATAVIEVPDIAASMPAQYQASHILHPTTLDSMFHVGIPMMKRWHGSGSVMPVHIGELLISTQTPALNSQGSKLEVSAKLTSSHFRASNIDMTVVSGGFPVIYASAIESRSLAYHADRAHGTQDEHGICYELAWRCDLNFLRTSDLTRNSTLADLVSFICFKTANLSIAELGESPGVLAPAFLAAVGVHRGTVTSYDVVERGNKPIDEGCKRLIGYPIRRRALDPDNSLESQGFAHNTYDVVLVSDLGSLCYVSTLVKNDGVVVIVLKPGSDDNWQSTLRKTWPSHDVQLTVVNSVNGNRIILARNDKTKHSHSSSRVHIITHSALKTTPSWATALIGKLHETGYEISSGSWSQDVIQRSSDARNTCIMVIDDLAQPILSDRACFNSAITLLRQDHRIIWLSLVSPSSMHQITGVARTAHAENDNLRLTVVHAALEAIGSPVLVDLLCHCLTYAPTRDSLAHCEREYRVSRDAAVLVPRLRRSDCLNRAIRASEKASGPSSNIETEPYHYINSTRRLALGPVQSSKGDGDIVFIDSHTVELAEGQVEVETEAFVLSKSQNLTSYQLGEYSGIVRRVGKGVRDFSPGDAVVALTLDGVVGANHARVPSSHVSRRPDSLSPAVAAALFLPTIAASYAIHHLAQISKGKSKVLIHGVLTDIGRASVAVARVLGATITATAISQQEALEITRQLNIQLENIIVSRPSLLRPRLDELLQLDAIIRISEDSVPAAAWSCLKPFGQVVVFNSSSSIAFPSPPPENATIHYCHITNLVQAQPDRLADLVSLATPALQRIPFKGIDLYIQDVAQVREAIHLVRQGGKVILQASPSSLVRTVISSSVSMDWEAADASYVVAGGMGDLGRRLLLLMARRGAMHLVTLSRRSIEPEDHRSFQEQLKLVQPGCRLYCLVCDITSESSVQNAADTLIRTGVPPVRGVIQSAVTLHDRTLETMTFDDFFAVAHAKVDGTLVLERVFASPHLHFFLMLSSAVNITGASGQANYNAGNAVQDAIAHDRGPGFLSMNIGWIEDAINTSNNKTILQGLWRTGLRPILGQELSRYFDHLLGAASSHSRMRQAIIGFNAASLSHTSASNSNVHSAMFCHIRGSLAAEESSSSTNSVRSFDEVVEGGDLDTIIDFIGSAITRRLMTLISMDDDQIKDRNGSILDLGLDSLVAIELRNWITREFKSPLQSSEILTDQPIRDLAEKVASRSSLLASGLDKEATADSLENGDAEDHHSAGAVRPSTSAHSTGKYVSEKLPPLPLPPLSDTLRLFEDSRRAIDTANHRRNTSDAVHNFLRGPGPRLYKSLQKTDSDVIAETYDRQVYLDRREPLPEQGPFIFIHSIQAPVHSQARRAAILTIAAFDFIRLLARGDIAPDTLHGEPITTEGRNWLFYATRRPGLGVDHMERHAPNHTVAVLRRGHVFQLRLPDVEQTLDMLAVTRVYDDILTASCDTIPPVCTLTADERDSWALFRLDLERRPQNAAVLACIDTAAFVMCLDDESPTNSGERYTQFMINGAHRPFANRWLDKTLQFAVTANGISAEIYEHSKLDGIDTNRLHAHIARAILAHPPSETADISSVSPPYAVQQLMWEPSSATLQRIEHVRAQCQVYGPLDHQVLDVASLGFRSLRGFRLQPNATAHLTVLLALYLVDGEIRPAWEKVSLGTFARGRVEWVQTVSPATRAFVEAAAASYTDSNNRTRVRALLHQATSTHSRAVVAAGRGLGAVRALYALRGAAQEQDKELPELFRTHSWDATRRGGPGQDVKLGFMRLAPNDDANGNIGATPGDDDINGHWDEAGFLPARRSLEASYIV
ncbi:polyketide synthase, partial [Metarhizium brunneum ARSEF 3297]